MNGSIKRHKPSADMLRLPLRFVGVVTQIVENLLGRTSNKGFHDNGTHISSPKVLSVRLLEAMRALELFFAFTVKMEVKKL
jgi:hypothetical protein